MQEGTEEGDVFDARLGAQLLRKVAHVLAAHDKGDEPRLRNNFGNRTPSDQLAVEDVDDAVAAFRFVHVVGADENCETLLA